MTKNKKQKHAARLHSGTHGISYTASLRATAGGSDPGGGAPGDVSSPDRDEFEPKSVVELLAGAPQGICDAFINEDIAFSGRTGSGLDLDFDPPSGVSEPSVYGFVMDDATMTVDVAEEFEGGTLACNVVATGMLTVQGLMAKGDAVLAEGADQVRVVDLDFNRHHSEVLFDLEVEATFNAIVNPVYEDVQDFWLDGMVVIGG